MKKGRSDSTKIKTMTILRLTERNCGRPDVSSGRSTSGFFFEVGDKVGASTDKTLPPLGITVVPIETTTVGMTPIGAGDEEEDGAATSHSSGSSVGAPIPCSAPLVGANVVSASAALELVGAGVGATHSTADPSGRVHRHTL
jgi:hypothetical protein